MPESTVSVIVPCYNSSKTIMRCIDSLLLSHGVSLQIILADDGSTDGTGDICAEYAQKYPMIIYLRLPHKGVSAARNAALRAAIGDYIAFADSDDYVDPGMFENLLNALIKNNSLISVCGFFNDFPDHSENISYTEMHTISFREFRLRLFNDSRTEGFLCNKLFSSRLLKDLFFDESLSTCEDLFYLFTIKADDNVTVAYSPYALYHYVQRSDSLTGNRYFFNDGVFRYAPAFTKLIERADSRELKRAIFQKYYHVLRYSMSVLLMTDDQDPNLTSNVLAELRLIQKEIRRNIKSFVLSATKIREYLSILKAAFYPFCLLKHF